MSTLLINGKREVAHKASIFYMEDVNIAYSFGTLEKMATDLGAQLADGDILVVDNRKKTKRKAYKKTVSGHIIIYASLNGKNTFYQLADKTLSGTGAMIDMIRDKVG